MSHVRPALLIALGALALAGTSDPAEAGTLGKVNRSIAKKQASSRASSSSGSSNRPAPDRGPRHHQVTDQPSPRSCFTCQTIGWSPSGQRIRAWKPPELEIYLGYENVRGSDGSLNGSFRLAHGLVALGLSSSSYFESDRLAKGEPEEQSRLTVWDISLQARALQVRNTTTLWLGVGYGQVHSNAFETASGGSLGAFVRHRLLRGLDISGSARGIIYTDDLKAGELRAGVTASVFHVGYRYLEFNVGPPLAGPELGVNLRF